MLACHWVILLDAFTELISSTVNCMIHLIAMLPIKPLDLIVCGVYFLDDNVFAIECIYARE